jgi:hypothetical protein
MDMWRVLGFILGLFLVLWTLASAIRTFVLPRSAPDRLTFFVFLGMRRLFDLRLLKAASYEQRDRIMAFFAPVSLLMLVPAWLTLVLIGYTLMYRAFGFEDWQAAFTVSGSSLLTLGFSMVKDVPTTILAFSEAAIGLILIALLIAYLPTIYSAFSRREAVVTLLEVRAGSPPSAVEMLSRFHRLKRMEKLNELWVTWEQWFADVEESHTSLAALAFFRSPQSDRSWITAAGTILDTASLVSAAVDVPRDVQAELTIRAGYICLRRICDFFAIKYNAEPSPNDPISISRIEFDAVCDELAAVGVPMKPDRDQAWRNYAGWRVNYDVPLLALASLTMAPYAPWSSDRSLRRPRRITIRDAMRATRRADQNAK